MAKPKLALIPAAQGSKFYSVLPSSGVGDFDFTRSGSATRINSQGLIETVGNGVSRLNYPLIDGKVVGCPHHILEPQSTNLLIYSENFSNGSWLKLGASVEGNASTAGSELVTNGSFDTDTSWTKGTGWAISGGVATHTGSTGNLTQNIGMSGKSVLVTFNIVSIADGVVNIFDNSVGTFALFSFNTVGVKTFYLHQAGNEIGFRSSSTSASIDNVSVKEVQGFASPSSDNPFGALNLVEDTSNGTHILYRNNVATGNGQNTLSVKVKANGRNWILLYDAENGDRVFFDLENGIAGSTIGSPDAFSITALPNGWYDISLTSTSTAKVDFQIYLAESDGVSSYTGNGVSGIYVYAAQLEFNSYQTSYIPTVASAVTRSAEVANGSGDASTFNDSEGVLMAEISALDNDGTRRSISINDGSSANRFILRFGNTDNTIEFIAVSNTSAVLLSSVTVPNTLSSNKVAAKWNSNNYVLYINGIIETSINNLIKPLVLNKLQFNDGNSGFNPFYGNTKQIQYFDSALTDSELETLTSWVSFSDMANGQLYTIQ